jgi:hypothetical protein
MQYLADNLILTRTARLRRASLDENHVEALGEVPSVFFEDLYQLDAIDFNRSRVLEWRSDA